MYVELAFSKKVKPRHSYTALLPVLAYPVSLKTLAPLALTTISSPVDRLLPRAINSIFVEITSATSMTGICICAFGTLN